MPDSCVGCAHLVIEFEGDWSEVTPGAGFEISCNLGLFHFGQNESQQAFEKAITTSKTCGKFELREDLK